MIYRARTLVPMSSPPVEDGAVAVRGPSVAAAGPWADVRREFPTDEVTDLGEVALLPGFVNAHCHLDYSGLRHAILPPKNFAEWVGRINALKRCMDADDYLAAIARGFPRTGALGHDDDPQRRVVPRADVEDAPAAVAHLVVLRDDRRAPRHAHRGTRRRGTAVFSGGRAGTRPGGLARRHGAQPARALHRVRRALPARAGVRAGPRHALDDAPR